MIKCCKDCCERQPGCHDRCGKYQSEKAAAQALEALETLRGVIGDAGTKAAKKLIKGLEEPLVRCKDCRFFFSGDDGEKGCWLDDLMHRENGFCDHGEREDENA